MSNSVIIVQSTEDIQALRERMHRNLIKNEALLRISESHNYLSLLRQLKFTKSMIDPLFEYDTNFIEYLNQTFTYTVAIITAEKLLLAHPNKTLEINMGTRTGYDIVSTDGNVICECFASTSPKSNNKLEKDAARVSENHFAQNKYVAFYCESNKEGYIRNIRNKYKNITFIVIAAEEIFAFV